MFPANVGERSPDDASNIPSSSRARPCLTCPSLIMSLPSVTIPAAMRLRLAFRRPNSWTSRAFARVSSLGAVRLFCEQSLHPADPPTADGFVAFQEVRVSDLPGLVGRPTIVGCFE